MVDVYIDGLLGKEFGNHFRLAISRPSDALSAIDANKPGFYKRMVELGLKGFHYTIVVDGVHAKNKHMASSKKEFKEVHIIPSLIGSAGVAVAVGAIAYGVAIFGGVSAGTAALLTAIGGVLISYGVSNLLQKDANTDKVGSGSAQANALNKSFAFSNGQNVAEQGNAVPLGYGRLRVGSSVIQSTTKTFPGKSTTFDEFTSLSNKKGGSLMSIVDSQRAIQVIPEGTEE